MPSTDKINVIDVLSLIAAEGINPSRSPSPLSAINRILALRALVRSSRFKTIADNKQRSPRGIVKRTSRDAPRRVRRPIDLTAPAIDLVTFRETFQHYSRSSRGVVSRFLSLQLSRSVFTPIVRN